MFFTFLLAKVFLILLTMIQRPILFSFALQLVRALFSGDNRGSGRPYVVAIKFGVFLNILKALARTPVGASFVINPGEPTTEQLILKGDVKLGKMNNAHSGVVPVIKLGNANIL